MILQQLVVVGEEIVAVLFPLGWCVGSLMTYYMFRPEIEREIDREKRGEL